MQKKPPLRVEELKEYYNNLETNMAKNKINWAITKDTSGELIAVEINGTDRPSDVLGVIMGGIAKTPEEAVSMFKSINPPSLSQTDND